MTALSLEMLRKLQSATPTEAWAELFSFAWQTCSPELPNEKASAEVSRRDRSIAPADLFLATAGWDLWEAYCDSATRTSDQLVSWWNKTPPGKAVLVLDALSLREVPWIIQGATARNYKIHSAEATGAELPADTSPFAKALGFAQRSALENNGAGGAHKFSGATTESVDLPWMECVDLIDSSKDWFFWHHWPDDRIHDLCSPGHGLASLANEAAEQLTSDGFWALIERLTTGRRLIITGDHGYSATGLFPDTSDSKQSLHLKNRFKSGRSAPADDSASDWVPPIDVVLDTPHGKHAFALGRRKWKSQGGYPTLAHGGLSLLEVAVPFIEVSR
jgi:hypothetical protein